MMYKLGEEHTIIVYESHDYWYLMSCFASLQLKLKVDASLTHQRLTREVKKWNKQGSVYQYRLSDSL